MIIQSLASNVTFIHVYSKIPLLRPPNIKTTSLLSPVFPSPKWYFSYDIIFDIKTTSLIRPLLGSPKGGLNIGILLYITRAFEVQDSYSDLKFIY